MWCVARHSVAPRHTDAAKRRDHPLKSDDRSRRIVLTFGRPHKRTQAVQAGRTKKRNLDETLVLNRISTSRHLARAHVHCTYVMGVYQASNVTDNRLLLRESPKTVISLLFRHLL